MIRGLLKLIVLVVIVVALGMFFLGWRLNDRTLGSGVDRPVGTSGEVAAKGREVGAQVGAAVGQAADTAAKAVSDSSLTAKIKAKMALDDTVKALNLDVDTTNGVVTVRGHVRSEAERQRAVQLARETSGVTRVVDQLQVR